METRQALSSKTTDDDQHEELVQPHAQRKDDDKTVEHMQPIKDNPDDHFETDSNRTFCSEDDAEQTFDNARYDEENLVQESLSTAALPPPFQGKWYAMEQFLFDFPHLDEFAPSFMDDDSGQFYRLKLGHVPIYLFHWFPKTSCNTWIRCQFSSRGQPDWQHIHNGDILDNLHRQT